jgi:AmiR/NasT family two-component response regulator
VVIDSELPGIAGIDFVRILHNSREWRTIQLVPSSVCWSHSAKSVGTACDGRALVDLAASTRPDVIVLDISMPQRQSIILRGSGAQL